MISRRGLLASFGAAAAVSACAGPQRGASVSVPFQPFDQYHSNRKSFFHNYLKEFKGYMTRRGDLEKDIQECRRHPDRFAPRFTAWVNLIDKVKNIDDPYLKLAVINGFANVIIDYDYAKYKYRHDETFKKISPWMQTPQTTLSGGTGVCCDIALLKYETLIRCGFTFDQVFYVVMDPVKAGLDHSDFKPGSEPDGHAIISVYLNGEQMLLNSNQIFTFSNKSTPWYHQLGRTEFTTARHQEFFADAQLSTLADVVDPSLDAQGRPTVDTIWPFAYINDRQASYYLDPPALPKKQTPTHQHSINASSGGETYFLRTDFDQRCLTRLPAQTARDIIAIMNKAYRLNVALDRSETHPHRRTPKPRIDHQRPR